MAQAVVQNRTRIAGAGFTLFTFGGQPITFCQEVDHTSPRPVNQPAYIQPMDEPYVVEILVPPAAGVGTITLQMIELFGSGGHVSKVWDRLGANVGNGPQQPFGPNVNQGTGNTSQFLDNLTPGTGIFSGAVDIVDIFIRQAQQNPTNMGVTKIIRPLSAGNNAPAYTDDYQGCTIIDVADGENVNVGTLQIIKQITIAYTYVLRNGTASQAFNERDGVRTNIQPSAG